ncbi:hypothetical protein HYC85_029837 [Camellia sinensis]|uniref:PGG domain-containing protein n=1 Tax=Camellia sinensis TaxID=4442 RepID=A0A7J7G323_CAMSI|nr:hypothetical protein HYC85_029837 [Camellia sinensis]
MDTSLYRAAMEGNTEILNQNKNLLENQLTPNNNTVLHVAAQFGHIQSVMEILNMCPSMYRKVNSRGDTSLHIAAREGHSTIVRTLIEYANALDEELENGVGTAKDMMRMSNEVKDTALHEAVRNHHSIAVQLLTQEDPEFCHPANNAEETPLYLAAERGYVGLVFVILETCTVPAYGGPGGRTALHSAVIHNLEGCTRKLLQWKPALSKEADAYGWTPLHYAARFGYVLRARDLLNADKSVAYIVDKDNKKTALHLAASQGHVRVLEELISHCMDSWEIVDGRGQNMLHIAVKNGKKRAIKFILQNFPLSSLINQKDVDGNTPLHLLAASDCYEAGLVKHPKADMMAFNNDSLTPLDVVCSNKSVEPWNTKLQGFTKRNFTNAGANLGRRDVFSRDKDEIVTKERHHVLEKVLPTDIRRSADTHLIVAALITIATFAAGFTVPGGYDARQGLDHGTAILARKAAFKTFVITDFMAMIFSTTAMLIYFVVAGDLDRDKFLRHYASAYYLIVIAVGAMVLAFITGMYVVLAHSLGLAIALCVIGCLSFPANYFLLRKA